MIHQEAIFCDLDNDIINFKNFLCSNNSIIWKNCNNLKIYIDSTINKIQFINCSDISIKIKKTIAGMEIYKSKNIKIKTSLQCPLNYLDIYHSNLQLYITKTDYRDLIIESDKKSDVKIINIS